MNTIFLLLAEYETSEIPLEIIAKKYFEHDKNQMGSWARQRKYPFPIYRGGSQKSAWFISVSDLAAYLDELKKEARKEYRALQYHAA